MSEIIQIRQEKHQAFNKPSTFSAIRHVLMF